MLPIVKRTQYHIVLVVNKLFVLLSRNRPVFFTTYYDAIDQSKKNNPTAHLFQGFVVERMTFVASRFKN